MSYDIIYNKQFVKLRKTREVIPMLLAGSNNCFDVRYDGRRGRRARSWASDRYYNRKGKLSEKPEVILKHLDAELRRRIREHQNYQREHYPDEKPTKPADIRNRFGYYASVAVGGSHTTTTSWNQYRSIYSNGINKALTIEELDQLGVHLHFDSFTYKESTNGKPDSVDIKSEMEYFIELKKWREWRANGGSSFYLSFHPQDTDTVLKRLMASRRRTPREKSQIEQDHYFVLNNPQSGNLIKYTSRGFRYSYSMTGGKRFGTEHEADKYRQQLVAKGRYLAEQWKVERIDSPCSFMV